MHRLPTPELDEIEIGIDMGIGGSNEEISSSDRGSNRPDFPIPAPVPVPVPKPVDVGAVQEEDVVASRTESNESTLTIITISKLTLVLEQRPHWRTISASCCKPRWQVSIASMEDACVVGEGRETQMLTRRSSRRADS